MSDAAEPPRRPRLPPLTGALDSSDDSVRRASREYRSRQAKRRRRAQRAAQDSADNATHRSQGALDDSAAGDSTYRRELSGDATYRRELSGGDSTYRRELSGGDSTYRRAVSCDTTYRRDESVEPGYLSADVSHRNASGDASLLRGISGDPSFRQETALVPAETSIAHELSRLGEEVRSGSEVGADQAPSLQPEAVPQPPLTRVFIEKGNRFQAAKRPAGKRSTNAAVSRKSQARAVDLALRTQWAFAPLGRLCFGLYAGLALGHLMFVVALTSGDPLDFIERYSPLALPFRAVFFLLSVICCVASLDRYDISRASASQLRRSLTLQDGGATVLLYLSSLALSAVLAPSDDRLHLYGRSESLDGLWAAPADAGRDCRTMVALCAARAGAVLLAWLVVAANPAMDRVLQHLRRLATDGGPGEGVEQGQSAVATIS